MKDITVKFENRGRGLWVAALPTSDGVIEISVNGSAEKPNELDIVALEPFFLRPAEIIEGTKKRLKFAFLHRLIRVAVNSAGKMGLQFRNRLTGSQQLLMVEE